MKINLAEKYRPTKFGDFKGSSLVVSMLQKMAAEEQLPSCLLFTGSKGIGKTSMCRMLNSYINEEWADGLSYIEVDAASNSGVDNIRSIQETIRYAHPGKWRIVVLDEAHNLSTAAFNSLLKVLEDPPENTTFILVTTQPEAIPDTVKSRSMIFRFRDLDIRSVLERLMEVYKAEGMSFDPRILARIAQVSGGSLRGALVLLQQTLLVPEPSIAVVNELSGYTASSKDLMYAMLEGKLSSVEAELTSMFADSNDMDTFLLSLMETLKEFHSAGMISNLQFLSSVEIIWNMRKIQRGSDAVARTQLEAGLYAMFLQNFWDQQEDPEDASATPITKDSLLALTGS